MNFVLSTLNIYSSTKFFTRMKTLSEFFQNLEEALSPSAAKVVDEWTATHGVPAKRISEHVFMGKDVLMYPVTHNEAGDIHPDVESHLSKHGYTIPSRDEYRSGYAVDKHDRIVSIGKALRRTGADMSTISAFENDSARGASTHSNLSMAVTWEPHHVAGMSTGRGWTSCTDLDVGMNSHKVEDDIRHGTHVAYLVNSSDHKIENPLSRIALKPYKSIDGHIILRANTMHYGLGHDAFTDAAHEWTHTHFPAKSGRVYSRMVEQNSDGSSDVIMPDSPEDIKKAVDKELTSGGFHSYVDGVHDHHTARIAMNHVLSKDDSELVGHGPDTRSYVLSKIAEHTNQKDSGKIADAIISGKVSKLSTFNLYPKLSSDHANRLFTHLESTGQLNGTEHHFSMNPNLSHDNQIKIMRKDPNDVATSYEPNEKFISAYHDEVDSADTKERMNSLLGMSNVLKSKHFDTDDIKSNLRMSLGHGASSYELINRARVYSQNPNYTIKTAERMDDLVDQHEDSMHSAFAVLHPKATVDHFNDYTSKYGTKSTTADRIVRNLQSPEVMDHVFDVYPEFREGIASGHHSFNGMKYAAEAKALDIAAPTTKDDIHSLLRLNPHTSPVLNDMQRKHVKDLQQRTTQSVIHKALFHDDINRLIDTHLDNADTTNVNKILYGLKDWKHPNEHITVPMKRSTVDRIHAELPGYKFANVKENE